MALVLCPDCKKQVSSRIAKCPFCGGALDCDIANNKDFSVSEELFQRPKELVDKDFLNETKKYDLFMLASREIKYPIGNGSNAAIASQLGMFLDAANKAEEELEEIYDEEGNIRGALIEVPEKANEIIHQVVTIALGVLFKMGINCSEESFGSKHYNKYSFDYEDAYKEVVESYSEILEMKEEMRHYREQEKASRGHWVGGGFGVKGAIKGAVTASVMNAGTRFIHSFGDSAKEKSDDEKISRKLELLYQSEETKEKLCGSIWWCIYNIFMTMIEELIKNKCIDKEVFRFDEKKSEALYKNTKKFLKEDSKEYIDNIIQCIVLDPSCWKYYETIDEVLIEDEKRHAGEEGYRGFFDFLEYWGIGFYYPRDEVMQKDEQKLEKVEETRNIEKTEDGIEECVLNYEEDYTKLRLIQHMVNVLKTYCDKFGNNENEQVIDNVKKVEKISERIFCPFCGEKIKRDAKFCNFCGKENKYGRKQEGAK